MKRVLLVIWLSAFLGVLQAQQTSDLSIGQVHTLQSTVLHEERQINIALPYAYDTSKAYPVVYVLDGGMDEDFLHITGLFQFFGMMYGLQEFIVVGVVNVDRKRDFTFAPMDSTYIREFPTTGHSGDFIQFLKQELIPFVQQNYRVNDTALYIGQSLGGLLTTEIVLHHPSMFSHYFIVSPSIWWDNGRLLEEAKAQSADAEFIQADPFIYIAVGEDEPRIMRRDAKRFYRYCRSTGLTQTHFQLMRNEDHATILHNAMYTGLKVFLKTAKFEQ